jgi:hypothetical protein
MSPRDKLEVGLLSDQDFGGTLNLSTKYMSRMAVGRKNTLVALQRNINDNGVLGGVVGKGLKAFWIVP